jgi:hypothetical protein
MHGGGPSICFWRPLADGRSEIRDLESGEAGGGGRGALFVGLLVVLI